jgi:hypothetical protein
MDILKEFDKFHEEMNEISMKLEKINNSRINWCKDNREAIKSLFPKKDKLYQIIELSENQRRYGGNLEDEIYYFKPTYTSFNPAHLFDDFRWRGGTKYPKVKGYIYDINLKKIGDYPDTEICITNLKEIEDNFELKKQLTFIYLMIDKNTGYYKIGRSKNPKIRETTLQSEKPTIEMIFSVESKMSDEKVLHDLFKDKRIRGEWFDLSGSDINKIKEYLEKSHTNEDKRNNIHKLK